MYRRFLIQVLVIMCFSLLLPSQGYSTSSELSKIVSPTPRQQLDSSPVEIVIQFTGKPRLETLKVSLNGKDITAKFERTKSGMKAVVVPQDGLRISVKGDSSSEKKENVLWTRVMGSEGQRDIDVRRFTVVVNKTVTMALLKTRPLETGIVPVKAATTFKPSAYGVGTLN